MGEPKDIERPVTFRGKVIPPVGATQEPEDPGPQPEALEDTNVVPMISIIDELRNEIKALRDKDKRISQMEEKIVELSILVKEMRNSVRFRDKIHKQTAVEIIRKRHGIKVIPGHNDPDTSYRRDVARIPRKIALMLEQMNVVLPEQIPHDETVGTTEPPLPGPKA